MRLEVNFPEFLPMGDGLQLLPLLTNHPDCVARFTNSYRGRLMSELFATNCKVEFTDSIIYNNGLPGWDWMENPNGKIWPTNVALAYLKLNKISASCIPKINYLESEIQFAEDYLKKYCHDKIIVLSTTTAGWQNKEDISGQHRLLSFEKWQSIVDALVKKGYRPIQFGFKDTPPLRNVTFDMNLCPRAIGACIKVIGKFIGLDSGQHHLAVASGAKVSCIRPKDLDNYYYSANFCYDKQSYWPNLNKRAEYFDFENALEVINTL